MRGCRAQHPSQCSPHMDLLKGSKHLAKARWSISVCKSRVFARFKLTDTSADWYQVLKGNSDEFLLGVESQCSDLKEGGKGDWTMRLTCKDCGF